MKRKESEKPVVRKVLIALRMAGSVGRVRLEGIFDFLRRGHHWRPYLIQNESEFTRETIDEAVRNGIEGIIYCLQHDLPTVEALGNCPIPVVTIDSIIGDPLRKPCNTILRIDDEGIGEMAARHLLSVGQFATFAFRPHAHEDLWSSRRLNGFRSLLKERGIPTVILNESSDALAEKLACLPKPIAVFAANDRMATSVLDAVQTAGLSVPGQVAVLGVDNDEILAAYAEPPLSSIAFVNREQGVAMAEELERLMSQPPKKRHGRIIPWKFRKLIERESTKSLKPSAALVRRAKAYIERYATEGISVSDVVSALGVSHSLAVLRFRELEGKSLQDAILERRFTELKRRLTETHQPIAKLVTDCGFRDYANTARQFKSRFGLSMSDLRNS